MVKIPTFLACFLLLCSACTDKHNNEMQNSEVAAVDSVFEQHWADAWIEIRSHRRNQENTPNPQIQYASEFFEYFKKHPTSASGIKAVEGAFMMWGNLGSVEEVDKALPYISKDSEAWSHILHGISNAYYRSDRGDDYQVLIQELADEVTHPDSRSQVFLILASQHRGNDDKDKARPYYEKVIELSARPFDVQKAKSALYEMDSLQVGLSAPDLTLLTIDGIPVELSTLNGKVVLIEFWATTCGPCLPDIPHLKSLHDKLPVSEFQLVGITDDKELEALKVFLEEKEMNWPQVQEVVEWEGETLLLGQARTRYNVYGIPRSFLIDREGKLVAKDLRGEDLVAATIKEVEGQGT